MCVRHGDVATTEAGKVTIEDQEGHNTLQVVIQPPEGGDDMQVPKDVTLTVRGCMWRVHYTAPSMW